MQGAFGEAWKLFLLPFSIPRRLLQIKESSIVALFQQSHHWREMQWDGTSGSVSWRVGEAWLPPVRESELGNPQDSWQICVGSATLCKADTATA